MGCALMLVWGGLYASQLHMRDGWVRDADGYVLGVDFLNSWMMGRVGIKSPSPEENYAIAKHTRAVRTLVADAHYPAQQWSYPPNYMLLMLPFGALPYMVAWALFMALGAVSLATLLRMGYSLRSGRDLVTVLGTPASLLAVFAGQIALLTTAIQLAAWKLLESKPWLAGALVGLLSVKPQLGLLYPFFFIATGRWKSFVAAAFTSLALIGGSILCWGLAPWQHYLGEGIHNQLTYVLATPAHAVIAFMPTIYMDLRIAGLTHMHALAGQGLVALVAVAMLFSRRFRESDSHTQLLLFAALSVTVTPYLMAYDFTFLSAATILYCLHNKVPNVLGYVLIALVLLPILHMLAAWAGLPGTALLPFVAAWLLLWGRFSQPSVLV